jgi:hypothetical protein
MLSALPVRMELFDSLSEILCLIVCQRIIILLSPKLPGQEMVLGGRQVPAGSRPQEEAISTGEDPIEDGQKGLGG